MNAVHNEHDNAPLTISQSLPRALTFVPAEGQVPVSIFKGNNAEFLVFSNHFCGKKEARKQ